ncbi:MAG: hypothetical protein WCI21_00210 [Alphaproteobacteria bacterium]
MGLPLVIVCDWIPPAFGAVGQYQDRRARMRAAEGNVAVLIGLGSRAEVLQEGSLTIVRLAAVRPPPKASMARRALWAINNSRRLLAEVGRAVGKLPEGEVEILVTGSPPFLAYLVILANRFFWRRTVIYRITDFYPETLFATGHLRWLKPLQGLFHALRRGADRIESLGDDQTRRLVETGFPLERIVLARDDSPIKDWSRRTPVARPYPDDKVTLLYSGNLGLAHELETFCAAYEQHVVQGSNRVRLWMNGQGARVADLVAFCEARGLPLHVTPPAAIEDLPEVLRAGDAHLVLLKDPFWGYVLPSKIYACLELETPIVYVGPPESDLHALLTRHEFPWFHARAGDVDECQRLLETLADTVLAKRKKARR